MTDLPGSLAPGQLIERLVRVDHAGEYGAKRIYQGQLAVLGKGRRAISCAICRRRSSITSIRLQG